MPQSKIIGIGPKRGRGPGIIKFEDGNEVSTFDPIILRTAAGSVGQLATYEFKEKPNPKDESKPYKNLESLALLAPPEAAQEALESTIAPGALVVQPDAIKAVTMGPVGALQQLELGFRVAVRQRELLEEFIRSRFKEGEHYADGAMFGSKKRVLLQPGAQLIHYAHGHAVDFEIVHGPMDAPKPQSAYTITIKAIVKRQGEVVGHGIGSCTSLIWSNKVADYRDRAVDPDKTHNSTLKMAKKRALVDSCLNTTAAAEYFSQDVEEGGYGDR